MYSWRRHSQLWQRSVSGSGSLKPESHQTATSVSSVVCLCAFSQKLQPVQQEQQQDTVDKMNVGDEESGQVWESLSLVVLLNDV